MTRFAAMPAPPSSDTPDAPRNCIRADATRHRSRARLSARPTASLVALVSYRNLGPLSKSVVSRCSGRIADTLVYRALSKTCFRRGTRLPGISAPISDFQKFSLLQPQISCLSGASCSERGAYRDRHGTLERDAVDAMASSRA
jgi:hypothetical protein